jgi:hypothetical protein
MLLEREEKLVGGGSDEKYAYHLQVVSDMRAYVKEYSPR